MPVASCDISLLYFINVSSIFLLLVVQLIILTLIVTLIRILVLILIITAMTSMMMMMMSFIMMSCHSFECKSLPTSLSSLDLWTNPDKVEPFLATWGRDCWLPNDSGAGLCWQHVGGVGSTTTTCCSLKFLIFKRSCNCFRNSKQKLFYIYVCIIKISNS